jgi:hypothetical protein
MGMSIWERIKRWRLAHTVNEADAPVAGDDADTGRSGAEARSEGERTGSKEGDSHGRS